MRLFTSRTSDLLRTQPPMNPLVIQRVKRELKRHGVVLEQSREWDMFLEAHGAEAITFSDGSMAMHTRVSASGFFEELIHLGQIWQGRSNPTDVRVTLLLEIEAQERLLKHSEAYGLSIIEVQVLTKTWQIIE